MGYLIKWEEGGEKITLEIDTISCSHCQKVMPKKTWRDDGGWCFGCGKPVCYLCVPRMEQVGCMPFKKQIDRAWEQLHRKGVI